jgi:hypothetical protein
MEMSRVESNLFELDSIRIGSARNSARIRHKLFFQLEFSSFRVHEQSGSTHWVQFVLNSKLNSRVRHDFFSILLSIILYTL